MTVGTRSLLFGAHQFMIHPWFVAWAWCRLYGFPRDPRLWMAFFVHDLGYVGKPNMDGEEGETHIWLGAKVLGWLFDVEWPWNLVKRTLGRLCDWIWGKSPFAPSWFCLSFHHSRFQAKKYGVTVSRLGIADKLSIVLTPAWLYLPLVRASGEIHEYLSLAKDRKYVGEPLTKYESMGLDTGTEQDWYRTMQSYLARWVEEHKGGREDTWTPSGEKHA